MDYEFWFYCMLSFIAGHTLKGRMLIYIGRDEEKYKKAFLAYMPGKK